MTVPDRSDPHPSSARPGTWSNRGEHVLYDSEWVRLAIADVVMPDGAQVDHHVVRMPSPAAATVMAVAGKVLLQYRHRFIVDRFGWEIPAGRVDPGETPIEAARREAIEESGWEPTALVPLCEFHPAPGIIDQTFHVFLSREARHLGEPEDRNEAVEIAWVAVGDVAAMLRDRRITEGFTFASLSYALAIGEL